MKKLWCLLLILPLQLSALPKDFVYLKDIAPQVLQSIRYAGYHNFVGRPIKGYQAPECILTKQAAQALKKVETELRESSLSLKVFDCYRPEMAVKDFIAWSKQPGEQQMKAEFYPHIAKNKFFKFGYVARQSTHSSGSTVDLTIVPIPTLQSQTYHRGQRLVACTAGYHQRFFDGGINMGTGFDCMDPRSHALNANVGIVAFANRMLLRKIMIKYGFIPYANEWWHFTLKNEPFKHQYFNFPVTAEQHDAG